MTSEITRRDFMNGIAIAIVGAAGIDLSRAGAAADSSAAQNYPPGRDGLRGSHVGSFEAAHRLRDGSPFDVSQAPVTERYDLVVSETLTMPGLKAQRVPLGVEPEEPYIYHFPDGNASIARMLVRRLIPGIAPGDTMEDIVLAPFDYAQIDRPEHAVRNWQPWHKLGVAYIDNPGGTFSAYLDYPVSLDGYRFTADPSKPTCLHLMHSPTAPNQGLNMRQQYRAGRTRLYTTSFADFEREIRDELGRMLGPAGFEFDRDVAAITVNRWPHGYAYTPTPLYDDSAHQAHIAKLARQRLGRIAIANSDSGWDAYTHVAIDQAHRAVAELTA
jgi:hypothetical protein